MLNKYFADHMTPLDRSQPVWGLSASLAWLVVILFISVNVQMMIVGFFIARDHGAVSLEEFRQLTIDYQFNGTALPPAILGSTIICALLLIIAIKLKRNSKLGCYLGIKPVALKETVHWLLIAGGLLIGVVALAYIFDRPPIAESVLAIYTSAESKLMLCLALIVAAPVFEEIMFRGFLQTGITRSKLGPIAGILIPSIIWAAIHTQYDLYDISVIFAMGLLLGAARFRTDSVLLTIGLHALFNALSTLEVAIYTA